MHRREGNSEMSDVFIVEKNEKIITESEDGMIKSSFSGNKRFKGTPELSKMSDKLPGRKKNTLEMLDERDMKKSDLPSLSSILSEDKNDSKKASSLDIRIEKCRSNFSSVKKNGNSEKKQNIDKVDSGYQISGMFSDGLSDSPNSFHKSESFTFSDKLVIDSLPPIVDLNYQELSRNDTIDKAYFVAGINEHKNKSKRQDDLMRKNFTETELNSPAKYSIDGKSIYCRDIGTNYNNDDDLEFLDLLNYAKKRSADKYTDSISTSNIQLSKPLFKEVFSDGENLLSTTLSNSSKFSLTPLEPKSNLSQRYETTSFENLLSSFDTSQPEYIKRKICSLNKKRVEDKTMFNFKLCKSVTEDVQNSAIVNGLSINPYGKHVTDCDSQICNNDGNQLEINFSPKYQNGCKDRFEKSYLELDFIKSIESDERKKGVKRHYPFHETLNLYNSEESGNYGLEGIGGFTSVDRSQNARYNGSIYQFSSPSQSTLITCDKSWAECPRNSFRNVSRNVHSFVKEWLDSQENGNSETPMISTRRKTFSLKRKRLFSQSENIVDNNLPAGKQPVDLGSEIYLSNYSSEYYKEYDSKV